VHGPDALDLLQRGVAAVTGCAVIFPDQRAVAGTQAINHAVLAAEVNAALPERGRRIHAAARDEMPKLPAGGMVKRVNRVRVHLGDEHLAARDGQRGERAAELHFPRLAEVGQERLVGVAAALRVVAISGPVLRVGVGAER